MTTTGLLKGRYRDASTLVGAGDVVTTVNDYFLYHQALKQNVLLNETSKKLLLKPYFGNEGYSLSFTRYVSPETKDSTTLTFFTGQLSGFTSLAYHIWEEDKLIVTFYNVDNPHLYDIADKAFRILYGKSHRLPKKSLTNYLDVNSRKGSLQGAIKSFIDLSADEKAGFELNPGELNEMGYIYLQYEMFIEAILIFKMNVSLFPTQGNTYDSLAEAYYLSGNYRDALINYKKALDLNADNANAANMIKLISDKIGNR
jgi:tetratricopeptide (TPR) repeat protein